MGLNGLFVYGTSSRVGHGIVHGTHSDDCLWDSVDCLWN